MRRFTDLSSGRRTKWAVIATWIALLVAVLLLAPRLADVRENEQAAFLPAGAESTRAIDLALEQFPAQGTPAIVVFSREGGIEDADREAAAEFAAWARSEEAPPQVTTVVAPNDSPEQADGLVAEDGSTLLVIVTLQGDPAEEPFAAAVRALRQQAEVFEAEGLTILVGGPAGLVVDLVSVFDDIDTFLLMVTVTLVLVLLILLYRSPVVALVPLLSVGLVYQTSDGLAAWMAETFGLTVSGQTTGIMTVVLFGAGTDYTLFVAARYREELARLEDPHEAMRRTMRGVGGAVASAGGTIVLAAGVLLLADLRSYASLGPVIALAVGLMFLAALSLIPAVLVVLGRFSFWPLQPKYDPDRAEESAAGAGVYGRVARIVLKRPAVTLAVTVAVLGPMLFGLLLYDPTYDQLDSLPGDTESVRSFEVIRDTFEPGRVDPTEVYVVLPAGTEVLSERGLGTVDAISAALADHPLVASVRGPSRPLSFEGPVGPDDLAGLGANGSGPDAIAEVVSGFVSENGAVARIELVLGAHPYAEGALDAVPDLREIARGAAAGGDAPRAAEVLVGGATAEAYDFRATNQRDIFVVLPLVLLAIAAVLGILLRSLVAPVYLAGTILFTYFATLGISFAFFELVLGHGGISPVVPFFIFVFLNALGVDYNIYLMSRIREESARYELRDAIEHALASTGGVITSAGIILAGTFSALMTLPLQDLLQLGFAVAIGVLMDTFITRTLIVPAIVAKLGDWNWWPVGPPARAG